MNKLKLFLSVMSVLFFSLNAYAQNVYNADELNIQIQSDTLYCTTEDGTPVTGIVKFSNEYIENIFMSEDGTPIGGRRRYIRGGKLKYETEYKDGVENGIRKEYDEDGKLFSEIEYKDGKKNGVYKHNDRYYGISIELYRNGDKIADGSDVYYDENNVAYSRGEIAENKMSGVFKYYKNGDKSGQLKYETEYKDGKKDGIEKGYRENGNLWTETEYKDGKENGVEKRYDENGNLWTETEYKDGKQDGIEKFYDENGKISFVKLYRNDKEIVSGITSGSAIYYNDEGVAYSSDEIEENKMSGVFKSYYKGVINGELANEIIIKDGKANGIAKVYHENGNLEAETEYNNGKKNGIRKEYDENGKLKLESEYKDGKENGIRKEYDENGKLEHEAYYINGERVDLIKQIKNPNMQYAKKCNIAAHINKLSKEMSGNPKAFYGNNATSILSDYTAIDRIKVRELLRQNNKCAENLANLGWTMKCEKSERKYGSHYDSYYDQDCLNRMSAWKEPTYIECLKSAGNAGMYYLPMAQQCQEAYDRWEERCLKREKVEDEYDTCEGDKKLIVENGYNDIVFMVDSFRQPDLKDIHYKRVVQALLKKYGPARSSKRKITKNDEKYEIFYWLDGGWVIQVEVKIDDYTDTSKVYRLDTYYINYPNCIAQTKYEQEAEQRRMLAEIAEQERIRKAKEEKNKNFEL